ncbi:hypothetical protein TRFO_07398 [Tritrichomonas foetus]|uniref:Uncharacterized protein n=1 Tax=Tritrichomonas foetus TaxID=1144522 RepID=A0A1J4JX27_9EUKA|nr:hypothetical protein TRFO_07398 [Tritrichomonas foetus]|eukprot:OHT01829.1 hypothetical protein TRFO_07398 [Tritrichomonas foetus]
MINKLNQCSALSSPAICSTHLASGNNCESSISTDNIPKFDHLTIPIISEIDENSKIKQNFFMRIMQRQLLCRKMGRYGRSFLRPIAVNHCCHANTFMNNNDDLANMITVRKRRRQTCDIVMTWKGLPKLDMQNQPALAVSRAELPLLKKPRLLYQHIVQC